MTSDFDSKLATRQWLGIILAACVSVALGTGLGFASQALMPVKTFPILPKPAANGKTQEELPKVYWLKQGTAKTIGNFRAKEKAIRDGLATDLNDREISQWLNLVFSGKTDPKEDIDAKIGVPFVRIGGRTKETEKDPVLTVTMPFKLKLMSLPVSEVPLQFTAKPVYDGGVTTWEISDMRTGHARVPSALAGETAARAVAEIMASDDKGRGKEMLEKLSAYRRVVIRDNKVFLEAPVKPTPEARPAKTAATVAPEAPATAAPAPSEAPSTP